MAMVHNPIIRPAVPGDLPGILDLWQELMKLTNKFHSHYRIQQGARAYQEGFYRQFFDHSGRQIFVAESNRRIVGFIDTSVILLPPLFETQVIGHIGNLYVDQSYRDKGVGQSLYKTAEEWFYGKGVKEIRLNMVQANFLSAEFWGRQGFTEFYRTMFKNLD